jgi:hypothetical protein
VMRLFRAKYPAYLRAYWGDEDATAAVSTVARTLFDGALALPLTRISGLPVFPILKTAPQPSGGPWPTWSPVAAPQLRIVFVSVSPLARAARDLDILSAYGPAIAVCPASRIPSFFDLTELDYRGIGLIRVSGSQTEELLPIAAAAHPDSDLAPHWRTEREKQLIAFARECHRAPTVEGWVASQAPRKSGGSHANPVESATS